MNKETKFRAWDGKEMRYWGFYGNRSFKTPPTESGGFDYPMMQFTGLYDKNEKEIYEGDIVKNQNDIIYTLTGWLEDSNGLSAIQNGIQVVEVIGNIYENPELLER